MVTRIFVEKKRGYDVEAQHIKSDLIGNLGMKGIEDLRLFNRYDVSGLSEEEMAKAAATIFSEPNVDNVYGEDYEIGEDYKCFAMEYLPGQYDQRADSAAQCVQLLTQGERPQVLTAKVISIKGNVSDEEMEKIKSYLVNPVESRVASMQKPLTLEMKTEVPADVKRVEGFISWSDEEIKNYFGTMGFAMTLEDLKFVRDYFKNEEKRDPSVTELRVIDTYWSDHCRHTTFLTRLNAIEIEEGGLGEAIKKAAEEYFEVRKELYEGKEKIVSLMDIACIGGKYLRKIGKLDDLDVSDEINACSIEVTVTIDGKEEQWLIQFKNETHNHPTEIEPFGGAATCLGGAIRDPLSGRAYVYQAMRVTGSGDPTVAVKDTLKGKLPSRKITTGAAAGNNAGAAQSGDPAADQSAENAQGEKSFTQADIDRIVAKRLSTEKSKWAQDLEREKSEAARLAKLSAEERAKEEFKRDKEAFENERRQHNEERMEFEATRILASEKLPVEFAKLLRAETADETKENIDVFKKGFQAAVEAAVRERLRGNAAPAAGSTGKTLDGVEAAFSKLNPKLKI